MKKKFWAVNTINQHTAEIMLYGFIGEYENIDDAAFVADLRTLEESYRTINLRINCGGGSIYMGLAIFNAIRNSKAEIHGYIDGIAASMGTIVAAACARLHMSKYAKYMTHRAQGVSVGNAEDMRAYASQLEQLEESISEIFAKRTGLTKEAAKDKYITNTDRWIGADQALAEKLIDSIYDADPIEIPVPENAAAIQSVYAAYNAVLNPKQKTNEMKEIALALGLPENATDAQILAAINKLSERKTTAENALTKFKEARAKALVAQAKTDKKIVDADVPEFEALVLENYEAAEKIMSKIPSMVKPSHLINRQDGKVPGGETIEDADSWEKLVKQGHAVVAALKKNDPVKYSTHYKAHYGFDPSLD